MGFARHARRPQQRANSSSRTVRKNRSHVATPIAPDAGIPTRCDTLLTPVGSYMCRGFFGAGATARSCPPVLGAATPLEAVASIARLLTLAALTLLVLWWYLRW
jgi:hypothetical protein